MIETYVARRNTGKYAACRIDVGGWLENYWAYSLVYNTALAARHPDTLFVIADPLCPDTPPSEFPENLLLTNPSERKLRPPFNLFFGRYHIDFPDGFFSSARMDMVLDYLKDPARLWRVIGEIKRLITPGGSFDIVDVVGNYKRVKRACEYSGFRYLNTVDHDNLLASDYQLSHVTQAIVPFGCRIFRLREIR